MKSWLGLITILAAVACSSSEEEIVDPPAPGPPEFAPELEIDLNSMIMTQTGLYRQDVEVGTGTEVLPGMRVTLHFTGWLPDGTQFDTSREGQPFEFVTGFQQVIAGFDEGVQGMKVGGIRKLAVPPFLGYGPFGQAPSIPANSWLVFEIEMLDAVLALPG
jgi:peptidylprolyl isomerase